MKRYKTWLIVFIIILLGLSIGWWASEHYTYTSDAYFEANRVDISVRIPGHVEKVWIEDNQPVTKGQLLFQLDSTPYRLEVDNAEAELKAAQEKVTTQQLNVSAALTSLYLAKTQFKIATDKLNRFQTLLKENTISLQQYQDQESVYEVAKGKLQQTQHELALAKQAVISAKALQKADLSTLELKQYQLGQTAIHSPATGYVTKINLQPGDYLNAGQPTFAVIKAKPWFVIANFKESDLRYLKIGQQVTVETSLLGWGNLLKGKVISISPAVSRNQTAGPVVPYVDPQLDWIRLQRRFPVKIQVNVPEHIQLRMGADARVFVHNG